MEMGKLVASNTITILNKEKKAFNMNNLLLSQFNSK